MAANDIIFDYTVYHSWIDAETRTFLRQKCIADNFKSICDSCAFIHSQWISCDIIDNIVIDFKILTRAAVEENTSRYTTILTIRWAVVISRISLGNISI